MLNHQTTALRPNILLVITDQQRADAVGYTNPLVQTPHLDKLAAKSIRCSLAIVQSPQCQPSRASLLTGRYPTALKLWWNETALNPAESTIGNYFRDSGYQTGYFGKMHITGKGDHTKLANHFGFQTTHLLIDWQRSPDNRDVRNELTVIMAKSPWVGKLTGRIRHHDDVITDKAVEFLSTTDKPYLCVVGYRGPHPPYAAPAPFSSMYDPKKMVVPPQPRELNLSDETWRELKSQYYGSVSWIDDNVGRLLKAVDGDAIVAVTSDHGDILGDHGLFSKGMYAYDGNIRVPLLFWYPNCVGCDYTHIVQHIDVLPTLLEAANINTNQPGIQGRSLWRAFARNSVINHYGLSMIGHQPRLRMVRTKRFKYWCCGNSEYLFNLTEDPAESKNIVSDKNRISEARLMLLRALIAAEDPLPYPHP